MATEIDRARTEALAVQLLGVVRPALETQPSGENVLVVLNAVAAALCPIFAGTGFDPVAFAFFRRAMAANLVLFAADYGLPREIIPAWLTEGLVDPPGNWGC